MLRISPPTDNHGANSRRNPWKIGKGVKKHPSKLAIHQFISVASFTSSIRHQAGADPEFLGRVGSGHGDLTVRSR